MADNEDKKNQRKTSDPTVDFGPRAKRTDQELAWLDSVMKRERMDAKGVRRDFNGIPIEPDAPQGLDWIRAHGPDSEAAQRNRRVMAVEQQQLNNDRLTAGRSAVEAMKMLREMQTPSVQTDAYGRKVATQNGIPVGYSTTPRTPQFEAPKLPTYAGENPTTQRANINAGGATNAARLALRSNIEQVGAGFRPANAGERELRQRSMNGAQMLSNNLMMPLSNPMAKLEPWLDSALSPTMAPPSDVALVRPSDATPNIAHQFNPQARQPANSARNLPSTPGIIANEAQAWLDSPQTMQQGVLPRATEQVGNGLADMMQVLMQKLFGQNASMYPGMGNNGAPDIWSQLFPPSQPDGNPHGAVDDVLNWLTSLLPSNT